MPTALGFANRDELSEHFAKHNRLDFQCRTPGEYERRAIRFLQTDLAAQDALECKNEDGDFVRYNPGTNEFAVVQTNGIIRTYFKPRPLHTSPGFPYWKTHTYNTNLEYFEAQCI